MSETRPAGLPAYSMPPAAPTSGQPRIYQSTGGWPTVTSEAEPVRTQVVPTSGAGGVPHQRGTVYGGGDAGLGAGDLTMVAPTHAYHDAAENTGSLTGHILNQGWADIGQHQTTRNNRRVVIIMAVVVLSLVGISLLVVLTANDLISSLFGGISKSLG